MLCCRISGGEFCWHICHLTLCRIERKSIKKHKAPKEKEENKIYKFELPANTLLLRCRLFTVKCIVKLPEINCFKINTVSILRTSRCERS